MTSLRYAMTVCASGGSTVADAPAAALTDAALAAAAGCAAPLTATDGAVDGATDAPCDPVAGLCGNAAALAIASAIANPPAMQANRIEILELESIAIKSGPGVRVKQKPYHRR